MYKIYDDDKLKTFNVWEKYFFGYEIDSVKPLISKYVIDDGNKFDYRAA